MSLNDKFLFLRMAIVVAVIGYVLAALAAGVPAASLFKWPSWTDLALLVVLLTLGGGFGWWLAGLESNHWARRALRSLDRLNGDH